jgi:hypothetical protein
MKVIGRKSQDLILSVIRKGMESEFFSKTSDSSRSMQQRTEKPLAP